MVNTPAVRVRNRVPTPARNRAERRGFFKRFGEGLQPGRVHGETKFTVAHGKRIIRSKTRQPYVVPRDQRVPVNRRGVGNEPGEQKKTVQTSV